MGLNKVTLFLGYIALFVAIVMFVYRYSEQIIESLRFQSIGTRDYIVDRLNQMFYNYTPQQVLMAQLGLSVGLGLLVFLIMTPNYGAGLFFGVIVTVVGWKAPKPIVEYIYQRRVNTFNFQMIDALNLMANGLKSGLSVVQAMGLVSQEMPNPIKQEFDLVLSENKLGLSIEESFNNLAKRVQSDDVEMFVTAVNILKETGGNLAETFDTITITIRERLKLEKKIEAMTQQNYMQGMIILCIPPVLTLGIYASDPEFMSPVFTHPIGWVILSLVAAIEVAVYFWIIKVVKVDV